MKKTDISATVNLLQHATRVVVKVGSSLLVDQDTGKIRTEWFASFIEDMVSWIKAGKQVVVVTSGSIALGKRVIASYPTHPGLHHKQAAAACGQIKLMHQFEQSFSAHGKHVAQILLTIEDSEHRRRYLNARNTIETLLGYGMVPVINENDTVATDEIRFGDNDRLAARVAQMIGADMTILLSDIDGLYDKHPGKYADATLIPVIETITPAIEAMAGKSVSGVGTGGMITKIAAAKIATLSGSHMIIASGKALHPLDALTSGAACSLFKASTTPLSAKKEWISSVLHPAGKVTIDGGAVAALQKGNSLLPVGVKRIDGAFERGDVLQIISPEGKEIARGLSAYSDEDARLIIGKTSTQIEDILGYAGREELIHRSDLVML